MFKLIAAIAFAALLFTFPLAFLFLAVVAFGFWFLKAVFAD